MTIDLSQLSAAIATIGALAGTAYATIPLLLLNKKVNLDALHTVATVCQQVVAGIEQTQSTQNNDVKKHMALSTILGILTTLKISIPQPFIEAAVEAAVLALHHKQESSTPTAVQ